MSRDDTTVLLEAAAAEMRRASSEAHFTRAVGRLLDEINAGHADVYPDVLDAAAAVARAWDDPRLRP